MKKNIDFIESGVTAPLGFTAGGIFCGIKPDRKTNDTALIYSEKICNAAALFTKNKIKAECVKLSQKNVKNGLLQAVIANSGNANCCTGNQGAENALKAANAAANALGISPNDIAVCSTGVIGKQLPVEKIQNKIEELKNRLSKEGHKEARVAIMTTDTQFKECAVQTEIGGKVIKIGAMCKGSGMIHINLGTMLAFITTDCNISVNMLKKAIHESASCTYNCVSIDGDTSTNDTLIILANGMAENEEIKTENEDYKNFVYALNILNTVMAMKIAADGEGASRLIQCTVKGARNLKTARFLAKEVISSNLVKAAIFGQDANWGRILCAMGYSKGYFSPEKACIYFSSAPGLKRYFSLNSNFSAQDFFKKSQQIQVFSYGNPLNFDEEKALKILSEECIEILITLEDGNAEAKAWGCDLTYGYVKINGDYRT